MHQLRTRASSTHMIAFHLHARHFIRGASKLTFCLTALNTHHRSPEAFHQFFSCCRLLLHRLLPNDAKRARDTSLQTVLPYHCSHGLHIAALIITHYLAAPQLFARLELGKMRLSLLLQLLLQRRVQIRGNGCSNQPYCMPVLSVAWLVVLLAQYSGWMKMSKSGSCTFTSVCMDDYVIL